MSKNRFVDNSKLKIQTRNYDHFNHQGASAPHPQQRH